MDRICWDDYFIGLTLFISRKSRDDSTRHGCLLIDKNNKVISFGYNGTPANCKENLLPHARPDKYLVYIHSEANALISANSKMNGCRAYISGHPCVRCLCLLMQAGIKEIIYGPIKSKNPNSPHFNESENKIIKNLLDGQDIILREWKPNNLNLLIEEFKSVVDILEKSYSNEQPS